MIADPFSEETCTRYFRYAIGDDNVITSKPTVYIKTEAFKLYS